VSTASGFSPWVAEPGGFPWPQTGKWSRHGLSGAGQLVLKPECNHKSADIQCKFIVFFAGRPHVGGNFWQGQAE